MKNPTETPISGLFSHTDDFINLSEVVRDYPDINQLPLKSKKHYLELMEKLNDEINSIPVFVKSKDGVIHIIPSFSEELKVEEGDVLMYLGKPLPVINN